MATLAYQLSEFLCVFKKKLELSNIIVTATCNQNVSINWTQSFSAAIDQF